MTTNIEELQNIKKELQNYKRDKKDILIYYINKRLNKSLNTYYNRLTESLNYISKQNDLKILKTMKKVYNERN